ncbi:MAG: sulfotransferase family protein [Pseudomonadota bacterium]
MAEARRLTHPLCGADLKTLITVLARGGVGRRGLAQATIALFSAVGRLPFTLSEWAYVEARRGRQTPFPPPVFILGHWRSGTTHLYNLMARDKQWGTVSPFAAGLPWEVLSLGRLCRPLLKKSLPEHRYIDNVAVAEDSPQEDEIALANMTPLSFYHALYFPRRFHEFFDAGVFFDGVPQARIEGWQRCLSDLYLRLALDQGGRRLVIKNPVYTARPALLRRMWPEAGFIHIHRNPYKVFVSMRNFWRALLREFALADYGHVDIDAVVFSTYRRMMDAFLAQTKDWPENRLVELRFEDLQSDPVGQMGKVYDRLGLAGFDTAKPSFEAYLEKVKDYRKNTFALPADLIARIEREWAPYIARWDYAPPQAA